MPDLALSIDDRLMTAAYWMPLREGWSVSPMPVQVERHGSPRQYREAPVVLLADSILASQLLDSHFIIRDHAIVTRRESMLTMVTNDRPDNVESATLSTHDLSLSAKALAELVIPTFYGITIQSWTEDPLDVDESTIRITEGPEALLPTADEAHYHEDLGRAWFLMTATPYVSHVTLAPRSALQEDPAAVRRATDVLTNLLGASNNHRRELRRNLSKDHGIDREVIADALTDQTYTLDDEAANGLRELYTRAGLLSNPAQLDGSLIRLG
jgi:predicted solute-binding protein